MFKALNINATKMRLKLQRKHPLKVSLGSVLGMKEAAKSALK